MLKVDIKKIILNTNGANRDLLRNIVFTLSGNNIYTILGKNGSGKSTLIKSLTGLLNRNLYKVDEKVFWFDKNIFEMETARLLDLRRREIKYVLQDLTNNYDPLKKLKYYFDISGVDEKEIPIYLQSFLLPDYQTISNLHSYEISGGMAQRLSLMFAMFSNPKLLILDEPTSAIDYANINLIKLKLMDFRKMGGSVLIVTQDINFAKEISDQIAFLQDGEVSEFINSSSFFSDSIQKPYSGFLKSFNELR